MNIREYRAPLHLVARKCCICKKMLHLQENVAFSCQWNIFLPLNVKVHLAITESYEDDFYISLFFYVQLKWGSPNDVLKQLFPGIEILFPLDYESSHPCCMMNTRRIFSKQSLSTKVDPNFQTKSCYDSLPVEIAKNNYTHLFCIKGWRGSHCSQVLHPAANLMDHISS